MTALQTVSLREAQFILGRPEAEINRAIDRGDIDKLMEEVVEPADPPKKRKRSTRPGQGKRRAGTRTHHRAALTVTRKVRKLGEAELVFLAVQQQLHGELTPAGRRKLYDAIKALKGKGKVTIGPLEVQTKWAAQQIRERWRELVSVRSGVVHRLPADPVIKGTDVSVYVIAGLAEGQTLDEVVEDYPGVTVEQVRQASAYAQAYPKKGRPYPARSFKRMLGDLAVTGAFDEEPGETEPLRIDMIR